MKAILLISAITLVCACQSGKTEQNSITEDTAFNYIDSAEEQGYDVTIPMDGKE